MLKYYKTFDYEQNQPVREKGSVQLIKSSISTNLAANFPELCFSINQNGRLLYFAAFSLDEFSNWVKNIELASQNYDSSDNQISDKFLTKNEACNFEYILI